MMTSDQARAVAQVFRRFVNSEDRPWDDLDEQLNMLDWLDDDQLHREADVVFEQHKNKNTRCSVPHKNDECFVPTIIEAVNAILELYKETGQMHKNNRYILQYYIGLTHIGMILAD